MRKSTSILLRLARLLPGTRADLNMFALYPALTRIGWIESRLRQLPLDASGQPLPWYTYPAIAFLEERAPDRVNVFEYGAGFSTLWWSTRSRRVVSCEHDNGWLEAIRPRLPENAEARWCRQDENGEYCRSVLTAAMRFEIVVIDGVDRNNCAEPALAALTDDGVVIWDNSDRPEYRSGFDVLEGAGFRELPFSGFGPINEYLWTTSIFYRNDNCLGI
jgi:hypothetical protein